jgi:hypothetical protein
VGYVIVFQTGDSTRIMSNGSRELVPALLTEALAQVQRPPLNVKIPSTH